MKRLTSAALLIASLFLGGVAHANEQQSKENTASKIEFANKINNLNVKVVDRDKVFFKGFLDSPVLLYKSEHSMIYDMFASDPVKMLGCAVYMFEHKLPASYLKSFICKGNITSMVDRMSNAFSSQSDEVKQKQIFRFTIDAQNGCMMLGKTKELEKGIILL